MVAWTVPPGRLSRSERRAATPAFSSARGSIASSGPPGAITAATSKLSAGFSASISSVGRMPICTPSTPSGKTMVLRIGMTGSWSGCAGPAALRVMCSEDPVVEMGGGARQLLPDRRAIRREEPALLDDPAAGDHHIRHVLPRGRVHPTGNDVRVAVPVHERLEPRVRSVDGNQVRGRALGDRAELALDSERVGAVAGGGAKDLLGGHGVRAVAELLHEAELAHLEEQVVRV